MTSETGRFPKMPIPYLVNGVTSVIPIENGVPDRVKVLLGDIFCLVRVYSGYACVDVVASLGGESEYYTIVNTFDISAPGGKSIDMLTREIVSYCLSYFDIDSEVELTNEDDGDYDYDDDNEEEEE